MDPKLLDLIYRFINFIVVIISISLIFAPFYINAKLIKSRGRQSEKFLWMLLTLIFSWFITLVLAVMKPKETT